MIADEERDLFTTADKVLLDDDDGDPAGIDERKHAKLIDAISSLDGRKSSKLSHRTVPVGQVSEFSFSSKPDGSKVSLSRLIGSLKKTTTHGELKKQLHSIKTKKKTGTVPTPLPKPEAERIHRDLSYQNTVDDVSKWESVVQENRRSDQIVFPLERPAVQVYNVTSDEYVKRFKARTPLELEVARLLGMSENVLDREQELTVAEERALKAMSLKEAQARRAELQKYRVLLSYKEAKARRQKKIKSKSYHRHMKRSRLKEEEKSIEQMRKTDPESYAEKLLELDRQRIQERMSLKHRGGSKFARKQMVFGKHNDQTRQSVQDMIQKNKELTKKIRPPDEDIESDSDPDETPQTFSPFMTTEDVPSKRHNPWMTAKPLKNLGTIPRDVTGAANEASLKDEESDMEGETSEIKEHGTRSSADKFTSINVSHEQIMADAVVNHVVEKTSVRKSTKNKKNGVSLVDKAHLTQKIADKKRKRKKDSANQVDSIEIKANEKNSKSKKRRTKGETKTGGKIIKKADDDDEDDVDEDNEDLETSRRNVSTIDSVEDEIETIFNLAEQRVGSERQMSKIKSKIRNKKSNKKNCLEKGESKSDANMVKNTDDDIDEQNEGNIETSQRIQTLEDVEEYLANVDDDQNLSNYDEQVKHAENNNKNEREMANNSSEEVHVDPKKLFTIQTKIKNSHTPSTTDADDNIDNQDEEAHQRMTIAQAFADDDVIAEFREEKETLVSGETPKDIDLTLPGWGSWTGGGIKPSEKKRERFIVKAPVGPRRKDLHLGHAIISENKDKAIAKHKVNSLPFPYMDTQQFERSIRTPIGPLWNPETTFRELSKPKVVTLSGQIIAPINKNALVNADESNADMSFGEKPDDVKMEPGNRRRGRKGKNTKIKQSN